MAFKKASQINGIPLHYARTSAHPYGTRGVRVTFRMEKSFHAKLEACFAELFAACPLGKPEVMTSAGFYVNKPGAHGRGRALDIDALFWPDFTLLTTAFPQHRELYLGIESYLRRHFGIVLNYEYNRAHEDHWHVDDSVSTSFSKRSRSKVLYLQLTLRHLYGLNVVVDGLYGPQTEGAYEATMTRLGLTPNLRKANWMQYLEHTGRVAFGLFERKTSPRALLDRVYLLAERIPGEESRALVEALNAFSGHPQTSKWLGKMAEPGEVLAEVIGRR